MRTGDHRRDAAVVRATITRANAIVAARHQRRRVHLHATTWQLCVSVLLHLFFVFFFDDTAGKFKGAHSAVVRRREERPARAELAPPSDRQRENKESDSASARPTASLSPTH